MEFRTSRGELSPYQDRPEAICLKAKKKICNIDHCPLHNFDDEGKHCVPFLCNHYVELKEVEDV